MDKKPQENKEQIFHSLGNKSGSFPLGAVIFFLLAIIIGVGFGYFLSQKSATGTSSSSTTATDASGIQKGVMYGSNDTSTFKDSAQGTLQAGGIDGEGQFHLVRPGGDSQNVYVTSSLVDLSKFVGHKVQVWGQTQTAKHAGWLMDVGRMEELQ